MHLAFLFHPAALKENHFIHRLCRWRENHFIHWHCNAKCLLIAVCRPRLPASFLPHQRPIQSLSLLVFRCPN